MLRVCGARNVFADRPERYPTVTLDEIAVERPAVILLAGRAVPVQARAPGRFRGYVEVPAGARWADPPRGRHKPFRGTGLGSRKALSMLPR